MYYANVLGLNKDLYIYTYIQCAQERLYPKPQLFEYIITETSIYTDHAVTILVVNVYVLFCRMAVTAVITHVLQKTENYQIYQEIGVYYKGMFYLQKK